MSSRNNNLYRLSYLDYIILFFRIQLHFPIQKLAEIYMGKALPKFQQKLAEIIDQGIFQVAFLINRHFRQPYKFKYVRILDNIFRLFDDLTFLRECHHFIFILAERQSLEKHALHLTFQFPDAPALLFAFMQIKRALLRIINLKQFNVMAPA